MATPLLSVSWKEHSAELATVCKNLLAEDFLVDCTIAAEGQKLKAHRLILSACSPYFQLLFSEEAEKHPIVILKDTLFDTLKAVVHFVYHGETQIPEGQLQAFFALAESLQIKGLNNSPLKNRNRNFCRNVTGNVPQCPSGDNQNTWEFPGTSAHHEDSSENSSRQHHPLLFSEVGHTDSVQSNSSVSFEGHTKAGEEVRSARVMMLPHEQQKIPGSDDEYLDSEITVKHEPLFSVFLETNTEVFEDIQCDEPMSGNFSSEMNKGTIPAFSEQELKPSSIMDVKSELAVQFVPNGAQCVVHCEVGAAAGDERAPLQLVAPSTQLPVDAQSNPPVRPYTSNLGGATVRKTKQQRTLRDELPYVCNECGKAFKRKDTLSAHSTRHTGLRPYRCDVCGLSFSYRASLRYHKSTHTGNRPYRCEVCGDSFTQPGNLVRHKRRHTVERPYRCDVCGDSFPSSGSLTRHKRGHTAKW